MVFPSRHRARMLAFINSRLGAALEKKVEAMAPQGERIVRVETKTDLLIAALAEVKDILRQRLRN